MAQPARHRERSRKTLPAGDPKFGLTAQSEKLDHQVAGLPSLCLASRRIQFSVHTARKWHQGSDANGATKRPRPAHLPGTPQAQPNMPSGIAWIAARWVFIALLAYVAIYPIFDRYFLLNFLKLPEPWDSLIETYSQQPIRSVLWVFLIINFIPE